MLPARKPTTAGCIFQLPHGVTTFAMVQERMLIGLAVLLSGKAALQNKKVVLAVTGRNIDSKRFLSIIAEHGESIS